MSASCWWVNHSHTVRHEIEGSYLWFANKARKSKARSESDKNIQRLLPGDVVYSFADGAIGGVGVVLGSAREAAKPLEFDSLAEYADAQSGWLVPVRFMTLTNPLRTEDYAGHGRNLRLAKEEFRCLAAVAANAADVRESIEGSGR